MVAIAAIIAAGGFAIGMNSARETTTPVSTIVAPMPSPPVEVPVRAELPVPTVLPVAAPTLPPAATRAKPRLGILSIDAYPWANVLEAGRQLGLTPLRIELPAGTHHLTLKNAPMSINRAVAVTIRPGEETQVFEKFK